MRFDLLLKAVTQLINKVDNHEEAVLEKLETDRIFNTDETRDLVEKPILDTDNQLPTEHQVDRPKTFTPSVFDEENQKQEDDYSKWLFRFETLISYIPDELKKQIQTICGIHYIYIWLAITSITVIVFFYLSLRKIKKRKGN